MGDKSCDQTDRGAAMPDRYKPPDVTFTVIVIVLLLLGVLCALVGTGFL